MGRHSLIRTRTAAAAIRFRQLLVVILVSAGLCLGEPWGDRFVVRLAEEETNFVDRSGDDEASENASTSPAEPAEIVNTFVGGRSFRCVLPSAKTRHDNRIRSASRHIATGREAALRDKCYNGHADFLGEMKDGRGRAETQNLSICVGDGVFFGNTYLHHVDDIEKPLPTGGLEQAYAGIDESRKSVRLHFNCSCFLIEDFPSKPLCRIGDAVKVRERINDEVRFRNAVVARDPVGDSLDIRWFDQPLNASDEKVARSNVFMFDDQPCKEQPNATLEFAHIRGVSAIAGEEIVVNVDFASVTCCGHRDIKTWKGKHHSATALSDFRYRQLLAPLVGRCLKHVVGWWTYELCWPWDIRKIHYGVDQYTEAPAVRLGNFTDETQLRMKRSSSFRREGSRHEVAASLKGDKCSKVVHTWRITFASGLGGEFSAAGGSFNPTHTTEVRGKLKHVSKNADGCKSFEEGSLRGKVVYVKRGNCWFHTKAIHAEEAGAVGVVIYNDNRRLVEAMDGVEELNLPRIPTVLVEGKWTKRANNAAVDDEVILRKVGLHGLDLDSLVSTSVIFRCAPDWQYHQRVCLPGDEVDVKLVDWHLDKETAQWQQTVVKTLKATVVAVMEDNNSLQVDWGNSLMFDDVDDDLDTVVPSNSTYNDGVPCDSDGTMFIESVTEPHACKNEVTVHASSLCSHADLLPMPTQVPNEINCLADGLARQKNQQAAAERSGFVSKR